MTWLTTTFLAVAMLANTAMANEIRISAIPRASQSPILYGLQEQLPIIARAHGIQDARITVVPSKSSAIALNQLPAGDIDLVMAAFPAVLNKYIKDTGSIKVLAMANTAAFTIVCKPYVDDIASIKKNNYLISMVSRNTSPHVTIKYIGKKQFDDVTYLESNIITQPADQAFQLMQDPRPGTVDCSLHSSPHNDLLAEKPNYKIVYRDDAIDGITSIANAIVTTPEWLAKNERLAMVLLETINVVYAEFNKDKLRLVKLFVDREQIKEDPKRLVDFYNNSAVTAVSKINPSIVKMVEFSESINYVPPGSTAALPDLLWRPHVLK